MYLAIERVVGWTIAHWDAIAAGFRVFRTLRGRRRATQASGQSFKAYYLTEGERAIKTAAKIVERRWR